MNILPKGGYINTDILIKKNRQIFEALSINQNSWKFRFGL